MADPSPTNFDCGYSPDPTGVAIPCLPTPWVWTDGYTAAAPAPPLVIPPRTRDPGRQLVVSAYHEDLAWLAGVECDVLVYHKGGNCPQGIPCVRLPNIQREAGTYRYHIVTQYDSLAPITMFVQGDPFYHSDRFLERLSLPYNRPTPLSTHYKKGDPYNDFNKIETLSGLDIVYGNLFCEGKLNVSLTHWFDQSSWDYIFDCPWPDPVWFGYAAMWAVPREFILARPRAFYAHLLQICHSGSPLETHTDPPVNGYTLEGLWNYIWSDPNKYPHKELWKNPPLPSILHMASGLIRSGVQAAASGFEGASQETITARWNACRTCDLFRHTDERCGGIEGCGCWLKVKIPLAAMVCPHPGESRWTT